MRFEYESVGELSGSGGRDGARDARASVDGCVRAFCGSHLFVAEEPNADSLSRTGGEVQCPQASMTCASAMHKPPFAANHVLRLVATLSAPCFTDVDHIE